MQPSEMLLWKQLWSRLLGTSQGLCTEGSDMPVLAVSLEPQLPVSCKLSSARYTEPYVEVQEPYVNVPEFCVNVPETYESFAEASGR